MAAEFTFENEIFRLCATYGTVVILKMMTLTVIIGYKRVTKRVSYRVHTLCTDYVNQNDTIFIEFSKYYKGTNDQP